MEEKKIQQPKKEAIVRKTIKLPKAGSPKEEVLELLSQYSKRQVRELTLVSEVPGTSLDNPRLLPMATRKCPWYNGHPMFYFINSPMIGLVADPDIEKSPFRNGLRLAEAVGVPWVIISGNLFHLDVTKASKNQGLRAMATDTSYNGNGNGSSGFQTMEERIQQRIKRVKESSTDDKGKPIFSGDLLLTFGKGETEIVNYWVGEKARKYTQEQRAIVQAGIKRAKKRVSEIEKIISDLNKDFAEWSAFLKDRDARGKQGLTKEDVSETLVEIKNELDQARFQLAQLVTELEFLKDTEAATIQSNISESLRSKWYLNFYSKLIKMLEEGIPRAKVIATGDVYLKTGNLTAKLMQNPHDSENDTHMNRLWTSINNALHNGDRQPDIVFAGGFNLTYERYDLVYPARNPKDPRQTTVVEIAQLPMCLDTEYLKRRFEHTVSIGPFITRLAESTFFASGMVFYGRISNFPVRDIVDSTTLTDGKYCKDASALRKLVKGKHVAYGEVHSDQQEGSRYQAWYDIKEPPYFVPPYVLHRQAFLEWDAPICWGANLGDIVQGENFDKYHLENPEDYLHAFDVERRIEELLKTPNTNLEAMLKERNEVIRMWIKGSRGAGVTRAQDQLKSYHTRAYENQSEYYARIIARAEKYRIATIDKVGIISKLDGNHFQNTGKHNSGGVGWHFSEAELSADKLIEVLSRKHKFDAEMLRKRILAPRGSAVNVSLLAGGLGMLSAKDYEAWVKNSKNVDPEKFPYCISAKHKPSAGGSHRINPIVAMRKVRSAKGTTDPIYQGRCVLEFAGHIDRDSEVLLPNGWCKLVPCDGEFQTPFAQEYDFSLGDVGTTVSGLPMHRKGFFRWISFSYEGFRSHIKNGGLGKVDVRALFRNAL